MSKQSEAKEKQGYVAKAIPLTCANCAHMTSDRAMPAWMVLENAAAVALGKRRRYGSEYEKETNLRCGIGGFAVRKMGTCNEWAGKMESKEE